MPARRVRSLRWIRVVCLPATIALASAAQGQEAGAPPLPAVAWPSPSRADLDIPAEFWDAVRARIGAGDRAIGYTAEEMGHYGRSALLLPTVLQLFRDARTLPRFSGRISDDLLADAEKVAGFGYGWSEGGLGEIAGRCFALLAASTGRRTLPDTLDASLPVPLSGATAAAWNALPLHARELIGRLYQAADEARPWLQAAFDEPLLLRITGAATLAEAQTADLYRAAMAHQRDERFGQSVTRRDGAFELYETLDPAYLGYASIVWLRRFEFALQAFQAAGGAEALGDRPIATVRVPSPLGDILIGGTGPDEHREPAFLAVDLGGDDTYGPGFGASRSLASPVALLLDLAGDDRYTAPPAGAEDAVVPSFGAGIFGLGALCDLAGDDTYEVGESGLGRACCGAGLLVDFTGRDRYTGGRWTQGAAHGGVGVLLDLAGDDTYSCAEQSQGLGGTLGVGLLLDRNGQDRYEARDDGNISALYLGQSVAMSQGCGYGRRADLGDGHSLAGGFGLLVDGGGDDDYHAQVWAQGCGYWWGVGILEDRAGNDRYRNGKYSSGAAAHFAIGVHVDLAGDDLYNQSNDTAKNQFQGHARDGSIGVFVDGDGRDRYELRTHCAGSGDLGAIGIFWDRCGDDHYLYSPGEIGADPWAATPPLGSTTRYEPFRSFRDDLPVYGIFLDTAGTDVYDTRSPDAPAGTGIGADGSTWSMRRSPNAWGLGVDVR